MAEICCGVVSEGEKTLNNPVLSGACESISTQVARKRRMEIRRFKYVAGVPVDDSEMMDGIKRPKFEGASTSSSSTSPSSFPRECSNAGENSVSDTRVREMINRADTENDDDENKNSSPVITTLHQTTSQEGRFQVAPKFGVASVCGRRRDMEDAVTVYPSLLPASDSHYFAVYDGHGCSHVAMRCKDRLHELVKEEVAIGVSEWKGAMERSFEKMDREAMARKEGVIGNCRCELQTPECDAVGSTAVVAVVSPEKIVVANCGDSRAVLCRNGKAFSLSVDHKPDRPDELNRIEEAGGRVIYWDGARVLGVLAMSRAIGDNYLKPYVICEPEVTITDRSADDDCLILASDGLWDVVSNDTACGVARMCLRGKVPPATLTPEVEEITGVGEQMADKACSDASMLLTKLALARRSTDNVSVVVIDLRKDT